MSLFPAIVEFSGVPCGFASHREGEEGWFSETPKQLQQKQRQQLQQQQQCQHKQQEWQPRQQTQQKRMEMDENPTWVGEASSDVADNLSVALASTIVLR
jgi:hypothetical protein